MVFQSRPVAQPRIDPREYDRVVEFVKRYRLDLHDQGLARQLSFLNVERPQSLDARVWTCLKERLAKYAKYHQDYPFVIAPSEAFEGDYILAYQFGNGVRVKVSDELLARHALVFGASGTGKTSFCFHLLPQFRDVHLFIVDAKDDSRPLVLNDSSCKVLHAHAAFNLLQKPSYQSKEAFISTFISCWTRAYFSAELGKQVLNDALQRVFTERETPSFAALHDAIMTQYRQNLTYSRRDAIIGSAQRCLRLSYLYPGLYHTSESITFDELFSHSVYLPVTIMDETAEFLTSYLAHHAYLRNRALGIRNGLKTLFYLDEGLLSYSVNSAKIEGAPLLSYIQGLVREFGIGLLVTLNNLEQTSPLLKSNAGIQVCLGLTSGTEADEIAKTFNLTKEQREWMHSNLTLGQCLIKLNGAWKEPILATFPPLTVDKNVSVEAWEGALDRLPRYHEPPTPRVQTTTPAPLRLTPPLEPTSQPPLPVSPPTPAFTLNLAEDRLLRVCCAEILPATQAHGKTRLSPQAGTTAQQRLLTLGLLEAEAGVIKPGRGGKAVLLAATPQAYAHLNLKPLKGTRGGDGLLHRYLVQEYSRVIPECQPEFLLRGSEGDKSVDLFFAYKETLHRPILEALKLLFHMEHIVLSDGQGVALEVEASRPGRTAPANAAKNAAVGVSLTVVAVMPGKEDFTAQALQDAPGAVVVDALRLLQALREAYEPPSAS